MIASDDVRRVTFDRAMRGYRCEDVDDYLKQVADSIDSLAAENDDLQKKLVILAQRIDQYRADEDTLSTTMINAPWRERHQGSQAESCRDHSCRQH